MAAPRVRTSARWAAWLVAICFVLGITLGRLWYHRVPSLDSYREAIRTAAEEARLDPALLAALVASESGGDPDAVSRVGARGLCQLMPATAAEEARRIGIADYAPERLNEPALNLRLGASYLARQLKSFRGQVPFALAAYNAGGTNVRRWRRRAPDVGALQVVLREGFGETRGFVTRVLRLRSQY